MIKVSKTAQQELVSLMQKEGFDAASDFVRIGVRSGGCSGLSYELRFDKKENNSDDETDDETDDKVFKDGTINILVDKRSLLYLAGTTLEYSGGLNGKGFFFNNPNAQRTCGCGESFST